MSDQIRAQVQSIVDCASVSYSAAYVGQTKREDWDCDAWRVSFAYPGKPVQTFDYFTGLGLRAPVSALAKTQTRTRFPGLTDNDTARRTSYGRRYLAALEAARKPSAPHVADVLHSLILDGSAAETSFVDWCADYGYSDDSIKARDTYFACQENFRKLRQIFSGQQIGALQSALQDY